MNKEKDKKNMEKLHEYQGWQGRLHQWRDGVREKISQWREQHPDSMVQSIKTIIADKVRSDADPNDYSHIYRFVPRDRARVFK